jgi:thymidylate synthase (FAD)
MGKTIELYGDGIGKVSLIDHMGSDLSVVNAARVSFGVTHEALTQKDRGLIKYLAEHHHTSPFEHCVATFRFVVPMFVRSQHHRHRTWSYNEISRRYTDVDIRFYTPGHFRTQHESNRQASNADQLVNPDRDGIACDQLVKKHAMDSLELYDWMVANGVCREQARMVLPQNLYTEYYGTVDLHNLVHFIRLREHEGAQWEIQKVAEALEVLGRDLWPVSMENLMGERR